MKNPTLFVLLSILILSCNNLPKKENITSKKVTSAVISKDVVEIKDTASNSVKSNISVNRKTYNNISSTTIIYQLTTLADLYKQLDKSAQIFTFSTSKDKSLTCLEGTTIKIKAKSFVSEKTGKEIAGNVTISVKEYYKLSDILLAKLSTTTNGNLLETGGMIYITATSNNENCILKKGQKIEIGFPTKNRKDDMQLYSGNWTSESQINWTVVSNSFDKNQVFTKVDVNATYPGGEPEMYQFIGRNVVYPPMAIENGIQGTVYISFVVDSYGNIKNAKVMQSVSPDCDKTALNAVKKIPKMIPAKLNNENVSSNFIIPVMFKLNNDTVWVVKENDIESDIIKNNFEVKYTDSNIQEASLGGISSYLLSSSNLGWINCDRLWKNTSAPRTNYFVNIGKNDESNVTIVFHRIKSVMNGTPSNSGFTFQNIPSGLAITLVAIKFINQKPFLAIKETKISSTTENELSFQPVTIELLKSEMKKLDKFN